jgi:RNA polymerase sigma factor (sigma-70 family)
VTKRAIRQRNSIASDEGNLALVVAIARKVHSRLPTSFPLEDLVSEGYLGLLKAAERYDPKAHNGTPFSAFARQSIGGAILDSCRRKQWTENTRDSIDDPGKPRMTPVTTDGEQDLKYSTEAARALARLATVPTVEISIDRAKLSSRMQAAISRLPKAERMLLEILLSDEEPTLRQAAKTLAISVRAAEELHQKAISDLRQMLTGEPLSKLPRAA